jgi:hypothetical protein
MRLLGCLRAHIAVCSVVLLWMTHQSRAVPVVTLARRPFVLNVGLRQSATAADRVLMKINTSDADDALGAQKLFRKNADINPKLLRDAKRYEWCWSALANLSESLYHSVISPSLFLLSLLQRDYACATQDEMAQVAR